MGDHFGVYPGEGENFLNHTHQISIMRKSSMFTAWKLFPRKFKTLVQSRDRKPYHTQFNAHLFCQLVGAYTGTIKVKTIREQGLHNGKTYMGRNIQPDQVQGWLKNIFNNPPDLYCVNWLHTRENEKEFHHFKTEMLKKLNY